MHIYMYLIYENMSLFPFSTGHRCRHVLQKLARLDIYIYTYTYEYIYIHIHT